MNTRHNTPAIRRAVIAVTLSGSAAVACHNSKTPPDRQEDATVQRDGQAAVPLSATPTATPSDAPAAALPRVVMPDASDRSVDAPQRVDTAVLPSGEAAPIRPQAPRPDAVTPGGNPGSQPTAPPTAEGSGVGAAPGSPLGEDVAFTPDVVEPRVDPDISACSPVADGVCPLECTRENDRDCCEVVGRGGVCTFDEQRGCRCAVIGPFNPPERTAKSSPISV